MTATASWPHRNETDRSWLFSLLADLVEYSALFLCRITIYVLERFIVLSRASDANAARRKFLCKDPFLVATFFSRCTLRSALARTFPGHEYAMGGILMVRFPVKSSRRRKIVSYIPFNIHRDCILNFPCNFCESGDYLSLWFSRDLWIASSSVLE